MLFKALSDIEWPFHVFRCLPLIFKVGKTSLLIIMYSHFLYLMSLQPELKTNYTLRCNISAIKAIYYHMQTATQ